MITSTRRESMAKILVVNGPNLNYLGVREPTIYGKVTLSKLEENITAFGQTIGAEVLCFQSNYEGALIDRMYKAVEEGVLGIVLNPGAYTHTSIAIRDCVAGIEIPVIEVHLSNVHAREAFRHHSYISAVTVGQVIGFGAYGYEMAVIAINKIIGERSI